MSDELRAQARWFAVRDAVAAALAEPLADVIQPSVEEVEYWTAKGLREALLEHIDMHLKFEIEMRGLR